MAEGFANADASGQTLESTIASGEAQSRDIRFTMRGGTQSKTVRVTIPDWASFAAAGWTASFFDAPQNGNNISAQITSAAGWTTAMSDGDAKQICVIVTAPADALANATNALTFRVEADPTSETSALDVVKATWNVAAPTPDLEVRADNGTWLGANVRNTDGTNQTLERVAGTSHVVRGQLKLSVANAGSGQNVKWRVPGWDGFRAGGWDAKFFDAPTGGNEITGQITGEGWNSQHANNYDKIIRWEVTVPAGATNITRVLSVHAQTGAAVAGSAADVVKASIRVLSDARPDVAVGRVDDFYAGENVYSPQFQGFDWVTGIGKTVKIAVKITNPTATPAAFLLEPPTLPAEWSYKLSDSAGEPLDFGNASIMTPSIAPNQSLVWYLEIKTAMIDEPEVMVPIRFSGVDAFDECEVKVQLQGIKGAKYTLDGGQTWTNVETSVLGVPKVSSVGFKAIKLNPDIPWPDDPFEPIWSYRGEIFYGETVFLYASKSTPVGEDGETASVVCGNTFSMQMKVNSEEEETP